MKKALKMAMLDDHRLFLSTLSEWMKNIPFVQDVFCCSTYTELQAILNLHEIDMVFLDLNLRTSRYDGFSICKELKEKYKDIGVAILTQYDNSPFMLKAMQYGANAYFLKNIDIELINDFLNCFREDKCVIWYKPQKPDKQAEQNEAFGTDAFVLNEHLSKREREIFKLIVNGMEHDEIEKQLFISYHTLRIHRDNILRKLNVRNTVELVRFAFQNHLID